MPRRRLRIRLPLLLAISAVLATIAAYVYGMSWLQARGSSLFEPRDLYIPRAIDVVIVMWCVWVGSSIGSFLNVVAWRMPRGESINGRSHCPRCQAQLKARDNFPVFGWLALGGRCRSCHLPISVRYPIVEAAVGFTITVVAVGELYRLSLPRQFVHWHGGPFWAPVVDRPILLTLLFHVVGLAVIWALGLIRMDGQRLPSRLVAFAFAATALPLLIYPTLMVVPWQMEVRQDWVPDGLHVDALLRVVTSLAAATILARYLARGLCPTADPKLDPLGKSTARLIDLIAILAVPILITGWQASPALVVLASVIAFVLRPCLPSTCDSLGRFAIAMPIATTGQIVLWRRLHAVGSYDSETGSSPWPSDNGSPWVFLAWSAIVLVVPLWLRDRDAEPMTTLTLDEQETDGEVLDQRDAGDEREAGDECDAGTECDAEDDAANANDSPSDRRSADKHSAPAASDLPPEPNRDDSHGSP